MNVRGRATFSAFLGLLLVAFVIGGSTVQSEDSSQVPRMTIEDLKTNLDNPDLKLIDVRTAKSWTSSQRKIEGAVRENPDDSITWAKKYPKSSKVVLYCSWSNEGTSARVAQKLMDMGFEDVHALKGGWVEWEKAGYPTQPK